MNLRHLYIELRIQGRTPAQAAEQLGLTAEMADRYERGVRLPLLPAAQRSAFVAALAIVALLAGLLLLVLLAVYGRAAAVPNAAWLVFLGPVWLLANVLARLVTLIAGARR
ncbi:MULTISPECIES: hypothetical protein [Actinocorallia]|uniref:Helix-turn-helix protein n=2 Tax=Actinocorallia TaxID=58108 RepID=A0ABN3UUJ2_9ACTN